MAARGLDILAVNPISFPTGPKDVSAFTLCGNLRVEYRLQENKIMTNSRFHKIQETFFCTNAKEKVCGLKSTHFRKVVDIFNCTPIQIFKSKQVSEMSPGANFYR